MSRTVSVTCPRCLCEAEASVEYEGGDIVPCGSTTARTPGGYVAEVDHSCPGMTDDDVRKMEDEAVSLAESYEQDADDPYGGDGPDD